MGSQVGRETLLHAVCQGSFASQDLSQFSDKLFELINELSRVLVSAHGSVQTEALLQGCHPGHGFRSGLLRASPSCLRLHLIPPPHVL